jgi:4-methyl-5(b-hydroxyethyl)-thiazole monophosphate biosynthesis
MQRHALVPIADGVEEIEAVTVIDVLRRAGVAVTVASVEDRLEVTASRGVRLVADLPLDDCLDREWDLIVLPGGMPGAERLRDDVGLTGLLMTQYRTGRLLGAICAAPAVVLEHHGLLAGRDATCHPAFASRLGARTSLGERVVVDDAVVTSRAPGTALEFALRLVELLCGPEKADEVAGPMLPPAQS